MDSRSIEKLTNVQQEALDELRKLNAKKKDFWDRFAAVSTFLSTVVIAGIGLYFTHTYNERQSSREHQSSIYETKILEMQTVEKFIPHLAGNEENKRVALLALTTLGSSEFATQFAALNPSEGADSAADTIMATAEFTVSRSSKPDTNSTILQSPVKIVKWAYVGHYSRADKQWKTRYFDFDISTPPEALVEQSLAVREVTGSLNVREGMPTPSGQFPRVIDVLDSGNKATLISVNEWHNTGYIWAQINF